MRWAGVLLVVGMSVARADDHYPETAVDRPLLMYLWMGSADVSLDVTRYVDSAGVKHVDTEPDIYTAFSLGTVELALHIVGSEVIPSAHFQLGDNGLVTTSFTYYTPQSTYRYALAESLGYTYKALVAPHRLALYFTGNASLLEESLTPSMMPASAGSDISIDFGPSAQLQLTRRLEIDGGFSFGIPIAHSPSLLISPEAGAFAYLEIVQTFHHWDFYANVFFEDLTSERHLAGSLGIVHRWGGDPPAPPKAPPPPPTPAPPAPAPPPRAPSGPA